MFPLGRVLLPGEALPLRVFEPRYYEMMDRVVAGSGEFGAVLIARGWEVGGGDERFDVATVVRVVQDIPLGEGQRTVIGVGTERIRIAEWLSDDPYPRAEVVPFVDEPGTGPSPAAIRLTAQSVRRIYALASELGADVAGQDLILPEEPGAALWRLCSLAPLGPMDRQRLLELTSGAERAQQLAALVADAADDLTLRLGGG